MGQDYVFVSAGPKIPKDKVALWEIDPAHPHTTEFPAGGEAFVSGEKPKLVARTAEVNRRIHDGILVEVKQGTATQDESVHMPIDPNNEDKPVTVAKAVSPADAESTGERPNPDGTGTMATDSSASVAQ